MSGRVWTEEQFNCPVCLDLPTDPVTIPCGHSYCKACIADYWDNEGRKSGTYSCPECRQAFNPRPTLCRNTMLAEAVEQLRSGNLKPSGRESIKSARRAATSASERARTRSKGAPKRLPASAVPCDRCPEPTPAVKTCLVCMASFCESHLKPHDLQDKLKSHELIAPTGNLSQKICPEHKYLQEFFCRSCQMYVCWLCTSNQHKGHESLSTQAERSEKQKELGAVLSENHQRLQDRERELKDMKKVLDTLTRSSNMVRDEADAVLSELQESVQRMLDLLQDVMLSAGQEKLNEAQDVVTKLEAEVKQLKNKDGELKELINCQDNIYFLKTYQSLCSPLEGGELGAVTANPEATFDPVRSVIVQLREKVEEMCDQELDKINKTVFNTTSFTVAERNGQKTGGLMKLFSGKGTRAARAQGPPPLPSVSTRGSVNTRPQAVRNSEPRAVNRGVTNSQRPARPAREERDDPDRSRSSLRPRETQRREERENPDDTVSLSSGRGRRRAENKEQERENQSSQRRQSTQSRSTRDEEQADRWSLSSIRPRLRREDKKQVNGESLNPSQQSSSAADRQQPARQSDRWSLSSLLPRNRKKRQDTVKEATPTIQEAESVMPRSPTSTSVWGAPTEVNPSLFLDSPTDNPFINPAFPTLREINIDSIQAPEPRTRDEFLQYACDLTLDPNTAHRRLVLSEGDTVATLHQTSQAFPDLSQRFDCWTQVLCVQELSSERCYWEVEWRGRGSSLGVASASMPRKGADSGAGLGYNSQSWSLELSDMCCAAMHANQKQEIPVTYSPRVGVFLDRPAGTLSFYSVDDELVPLHVFHGSFPASLYAAFGVGCGVGVGLDFAMGQFNSTSDSIKICPL
ncbi:E3 ubiquitin/ISG15 ligase TRIM25 isoform X1 [Pimephales promelas]|uniref:E3 ubiquitin/ISG15 ligase TRIM25 isoform X1 n=1 Tax=Pimephales promelas TaxID=90988 RepID=UPI001955624E|nr:E3 ubiquitin/ISG15 ligase TRIM25 isoform X1 [Pimephales promelas]KAG1962211.1 tripartite motif-containing protein [Pimephales promelas]